jgi:hypothetical protein
MIAFSVPTSGAITIKRAGAFDHESVIKTAEEAVNVALNKLAQGNYVTLAAGETLDVAGISATFTGPAPASGLGGPSQKIAYNVMFGRQYKGIPVLGPPTLAVLDADANLSTFRKGWRDIAGEGASVPLATSTEIDSRRDALKSKFLTVTESTCGYTEDPDTNSTQPAAGVGCHYRYFNAAAAGSPGQGQEDWVNAAADGNARMRGLRKAIGTGS